MYFGYVQYKQKGFVPILILVGILVIVVVAGGAYYFDKSSKPKTSQPQNPVVTSQSIQPTMQPTIIPQQSPTPDETANWKTYTNNRVGYSVKYPDNWYVYELTDGQQNQYMTDIQDIKNSEKIEDAMVGGFGPPGSSIFSVINDPFDNINGLKAIDWAKETTTYGYRYADITDESVVIVDNISATIFATTNGNGVHYYVVLLPKDHKIYQISLFGSKQDLLLKMLSTFKFTQ